MFYSQFRELIKVNVVYVPGSKVRQIRIGNDLGFIQAMSERFHVVMIAVNTMIVCAWLTREGRLLARIHLNEGRFRRTFLTCSLR